MAVQFQVRRGTATEWETPVTLALGEFGFDTTNKLLKIGDGTSTFSALSDLRATGVIPSGGSNGQGLIKNGTALAWADYVSYPTGTPAPGAAIVRNSGNTGNIWASGVGLGTLTGLVSTSPLTINGTVGGSYTSGSATIGLNASALNTFLSNLSGTVEYANTATTLNLGTSATTLNLGTSATTLNLGTSQYSGGVTLNLGYLTSYGTTSTININTAVAGGYEDSEYIARITNISTGSLNNGTEQVLGGGVYALTNAQVNIGNSKANSTNTGFVHITNIYGHLKLPQWVSGALVTDANGLVGKQTVASANTNGAIVARDGSGAFSAGTISATTVNATTVNATTVNATTLTGAYDAASLTGTLNVDRIAATTITGGNSSGKIAFGAITDYNIAVGANIADAKLGTIASVGKVLNTATTATSANTGSAIVARNSSGGFSAGAITATGTITATTFSGSGSLLTGIINSATTATSAGTGSTIVARDGSGAITATNFIGSGSGLTGIQNSATTATSSNTGSTIVARDGSGAITATNFIGSGSGLSSIPGTNITDKTIPIKAINNAGAIAEASGGSQLSVAVGVKYIIVAAGSANCEVYLGNVATDGYSITVVNRATTGSSIGLVSNSNANWNGAVSNIYSKLNTVGDTILPNTPGAWVKLVFKSTSPSGWYVMASS